MLKDVAELRSDNIVNNKYINVPKHIYLKKIKFKKFLIN